MRIYVLFSNPMPMIKRKFEAVNTDLEKIVAYAKTLPTDDLIIETHDDSRENTYLHCMALDTAEKMIERLREKASRPNQSEGNVPFDGLKFLLSDDTH